MCGICGFNFENKNLLQKSCDLLIHRGPDDVGYYVNSKISLGVRRLSVIDLTKGHQPQHNEDKDVWVVFNGEIYNFKELRDFLEKKGHIFYTDSDTEVIVHAYEEWKANCIKKLRGQFAFCLYDKKEDVLILARDHLGLKPLYYYFNGDKFIFSSEIKSILVHKVERIVNKRALNLYFSLKYIPLNITLFKGINKVPPSSYLIFDLKKKKISLKNYWKLDFSIDYNKTTMQYATELKKLLEECVKIRLISDVPLGAFLSGGLDSSAIVGIMSKYMNDPVKTFSVRFEDGAPTNESKYSRLVADYFGTDYSEITIKSTSYEELPKLIWHLDDLIADAAIIPVYLMSKYSKDKITVTLTGDGADEVFAGYSRFYRSQRFNFINSVPRNLMDLLMKSYNNIPVNIIRIGLSYLNQSKTIKERYLRKIIHVPDEEKIKIFPFRVESIQELVNSKLIENIGLINQFNGWDLKYQLPNQFNMKIDKMTMAASLEARTPFLDSFMVEWANSIPPQLKLKGNIDKYILRLAMKDILPPEIIRRKKFGFNTPIHYWIKTGLREVSGELLERLLKRKEFFKPSYIKSIRRNRIFKIFDSRVWNLLMFELWYETFIEGDGSKPIRL